MRNPQRVIVVGGGVIGLSVAWTMARRGCQVRLFERGQTGQATSWAGAGILPPANLAKATDPIDQMRGLSHQLFPQWAEELEEATGIDCGLRRCGGWYLADTAGEHASMLGMTGYWEQLGIECERVSLKDISLQEPALSDWASRDETRSAWWVPDEYQLRSPWYLRALRQACLGEGVQIEEQSEVSDINSTSQSASLRVQDRWESADAIVLCGGAWIGQIAPSLRLERSVIPIRGQILLLRTDEAICERVINVGQRYLVCREDGNVLVGSCEEETGFEVGTTESMLESLGGFAKDLVPKLASAAIVDGWSGLRPMTFDGFPMIGSVPECDHVYVAGGHYRSGLHLSPATAVAITDLILGNDPKLSLDAFRVGKQQSPPKSFVQSTVS